MQLLPRTEIDVQIKLRGETAKRLIYEVEKRRMKPVELLAKLIKTVIEDDLFAALLDR